MYKEYAEKLRDTHNSRQQQLKLLFTAVVGGGLRISFKKYNFNRSSTVLIIYLKAAKLLGIHTELFFDQPTSCPVNGYSPIPRGKYKSGNIS